MASSSKSYSNSNKSTKKAKKSAVVKKLPPQRNMAIPSIAKIPEQLGDPIEKTTKKTQVKDLKKLNPHLAKKDPQPSESTKIAVIVNENNPLTNLSTKQIELIFSGDTLNWRALYGEDMLLRAYAPSPGSDLYKLFASKMMNSRNLGPSTERLDGHNETLELVSLRENAIAFVKYPFYRTEGVKVLAIDGIPPKAENYSLKGETSSHSL